MATFLLIIVANMKTVPTVALSSKTLDLGTKNLVANPETLIPTTAAFLLLKHISYIYYLLYFRKDKNNVEALINLSSKVNVMTPTYAKKLGFWTQKMDFNAQKIDRSSLAIYEIVIAGF